MKNEQYSKLWATVTISVAIIVCLGSVTAAIIGVLPQLIRTPTVIPTVHDAPPTSIVLPTQTPLVIKTSTATVSKEFPILSDASGIESTSEYVNFQSNMSLEDAVDFYRNAF